MDLLNAGRPQLTRKMNSLNQPQTAIVQHVVNSYRVRLLTRIDGNQKGILSGMIKAKKTDLKSPSDHVVLIHGLAGSPMVMWPLAWRLQKFGFATSTFGYASWFWSIEHHARRLTECLKQLEQDPEIHRFHIVAHSMGTIVTRQSILYQRFNKLNRIVMLASPNQGSPVARVMGTVLPFCRTLRQLSSHSDSFVRKLPEPSETEIGIVAARHDRVIPVRNSHLSIETDHVTLFSGHNGLLVRPAAARQVIEFLEHGQFARDESSVPQSQGN
jgi:esterase/lipase